jgi:nucleoid DNA-binding protein
MNRESSGGKGSLIWELRQRGFSVRQARKAVNAFFDCATRAVRRGERVEIPGGAIQVKSTRGQPRQTSQRFRNIQSGEIVYRTVKFPGGHRTVRFAPDLTLDLSPLPAPSPTETPEQIEARQLAKEFLGHAPDETEMVLLERGADFYPEGPNSLLRRLRDLKGRGPRVNGSDDLAEAVASLYWI